MITTELIDVHPEVAAALSENRPVVALESSIISYGAQWPSNVDIALELEAEVLSHGATPAICAIIDGRIKVGLSRDELDRLGKLGGEAPKVSRRDIAILIASGGTGSTTIAATMIIAHLAGIRVFSAGGLGGVHRGASESFDISPDLQELSCTPVAVVCAGIKSILDVRLTLEYLETHGVPIIGYRTTLLPGFYCRDSDFDVDVRFDDAHRIAKVMRVNAELNLGTGLVIANPIPQQYALPREPIERAIEQALAKAEIDGISGKALTPYLVSHIRSLTGGTSEASRQMNLSNARLAAEIAVAYARS
ncbi:MULTISPECIES: pseudouridine-5'-phosphate glycosidase [unclassified Pseudomonas]|uniref:pseudouridine-5'-phosphate glycosidase n=1 Tax=unclassified Pseudomonas TaxID=196821 RepID=UPI000D95E861|nr:MULTISPECIES: pseudouridine-5'-phosphate glycosidase [unclassified Pseudomonas]PYG78417.1 pseudouridine-5'-phosphate glycosidase [Pseudomonas sp. RV120224-01c]PYG82642.1 pseudouridine-5'-phosphate glycosidase [Pseudomonas sp. RV120224-01b]